jgi:hypothetical protein
MQQMYKRHGIRTARQGNQQMHVARILKAQIQQ